MINSCQYSEGNCDFSFIESWVYIYYFEQVGESMGVIMTGGGDFGEDKGGEE